MPQALKDGARATVNGQVRGFEPIPVPRPPLASVLRPTVPGRPPLVSIQVAPDLQQALAIAGRLGDIGEKTVDLLGQVGVVAALGLAAYGGYRWYTSRPKARKPRARRVRAELLGGK